MEDDAVLVLGIRGRARYAQAHNLDVTSKAQAPENPQFILKMAL